MNRYRYVELKREEWTIQRRFLWIWVDYNPCGANPCLSEAGAAQIVGQLNRGEL